MATTERKYDGAFPGFLSFVDVGARPQYRSCAQELFCLDDHPVLAASSAGTRRSRSPDLHVAHPAFEPGRPDDLLTSTT